MIQFDLLHKWDILTGTLTPFVPNAANCLLATVALYPMVDVLRLSSSPRDKGIQEDNEKARAYL